MRHMQIIRKANDRAADRASPGGNWGARHMQAWASHAQPVSVLVTAAAFYADKYRERYGSGIGDDGVLGPPWARILGGIRELLNGEIGQLDGGTVDGMIADMLRAEGFDPDNLP